MKKWSAETWRALAESSPQPIVVCSADDDHGVVYANTAFTELCGHPLDALIGKNLRLLQGTDRDQDSRQKIRESLQGGRSCRVLMRNYRADGSAFWSEMLLQPVRDQGSITHWVGFHRDAGERLKSGDAAVPGLPTWLRDDRLSGLHSRAYFEELVRRDWSIAQRESHQIALLLFDIDDLQSYNETFDRSAGDACIRRVARLIGAAYRRGSDLVGRWEGGTFAVATQGDAAEKAADYAGVIIQRVRDLLIHHPHAKGRYVSLSGGIASVVPSREMPVSVLLNAAHTALTRAKKRGKNAVITAEASDFQ